MGAFFTPKSGTLFRVLLFARKARLALRIIDQKFMHLSCSYFSVFLIISATSHTFRKIKTEHAVL